MSTTIVPKLAVVVDDRGCANVVGPSCSWMTKKEKEMEHMVIDEFDGSFPPSAA
jgi:hypothetical protein